MRYLGQVLESVDKYPEQPENPSENINIHLLQLMGEFKHVKTLLEREIYLRSVKHVINKILKEEKGESDLHLA